MGRLFIWLSGADRTILDECTSMQRSERSRFAGLGALVLIPAVLGMLSMMYAVSTFQSDPGIYITAGVAWFFVVASIDRYIVSTTFKSSIQKGYGRILGILARLVLALFVGVAVSHPLILLLFNDSINQELADTKEARLATLRTDATNQKAAVPALADPPAEGRSAAAQELRRKEDLSACLGQLQTAELTGTQVSLPCGFSSPRATCGERCTVIGEQKAQADREIAALRGQTERETTAQRTDRANAEQARQAVITKIETETDAAIARATFSTDYLAQVDALDRIEKRQPAVAVVKWFILLLFIVIDVLPLTMKLATPSGEYELIRDRKLILSDVRERVTTQAAQVDLESQVRIARSTQDIDTMQKAWETYMSKFTEGTDHFETSVDSIRERAASNGGTPASDDQVEEMRDTQNRMWAAWRARLKGDLEPRND